MVDSLPDYRLGIDLELEGDCGVIHERHTAGHASSDVDADISEHEGGAAGHVFAAVRARAFDDGVCAGVAYGEALAGAAASEQLARRRAIEDRVADDGVVLGHQRARHGRLYDNGAA